MNLAKLNLVELEAHETLKVNGGGSGNDWAQWLADQVISHWGAIKQGFSDGMNGTYNNPYKN